VNKMLAIVLVLMLWAAGATVAIGQEFGRGERQDLLNTVTSELPQGKTLLSGGERANPPGGRSPWHTAVGPKLLYVVEGTMAVEGTSGQTFLTCGPAPKLCLSSHKGLFFFHNVGKGPLKFVVVGIDPVEMPTNHEDVGQVAAISGNRVTLALGNVRTSELSVPRKEITIIVTDPGTIAVGDDVVTVGHSEKDQTARSLLKLSQRWQ
jgi:hypothetical protein